ncbi:MAG: CvpA family protein [Tannerella sp.]|jgi:membrane protein required for colicin V production|nr:CvpA family protein [Tannerella sp.]
MNWLDIVCICLAVVGFIKGYSDGFIRQIVTLIALITAIYFCSKVAVYLREFLLKSEWFPEHSVTIVSYVLAFILIVGVIILAGGVIHKLLNVTPLSLLNHLAGGIFALLATVVLLSLTFNLLEGLDHQSVLIPHETKIESRMYVYIKNIVPAIYPADLFVWRE